MAPAQGSLTFVLDENSGSLASLIRASRAVAAERVTDLPSLGIPAGTLDPDLLRQLGRKGRFVLVARDGRMLEPLVQREAWRESGVTLFLLAKRWGGLPLGEMVRRVLFLWPRLVAHAESSVQGTAWRVSPTIPEPASNAFRLVTERRDHP